MKGLTATQHKIVDSFAKHMAGKQVAKKTADELKANIAAAEADELRTEGHQPTRRPLSSAHEAP